MPRQKGRIIKTINNALKKVHCVRVSRVLKVKSILHLLLPPLKKVRRLLPSVVSWLRLLDDFAHGRYRLYVTSHQSVIWYHFGTVGPFFRGLGNNDDVLVNISEQEIWRIG